MQLSAKSRVVWPLEKRQHLDGRPHGYTARPAPGSLQRRARDQLAIHRTRHKSHTGHQPTFNETMQGIFTLALLLLNGWLGQSAAVEGPRFMGGAVVENNCNGCANTPVVQTLLAHTNKDKDN
ncbi:hypothetical protein PF005_g268 [Phytophthora fragariae]|uniref:Uncharacterized protein n=1 Tax=Phytophthora fragariae TaxID=53985 RepID=A0A6A3G8D0_9STRA|nr:hypothetical protein PF003_g26355 [Phytophthora fragariae]KAE8950248.1 hypothetical protein PF009_g216 [Phytophthora fragariae]KAE9024568.1 hypothetical protein PF011_g3449 [Phytophthora fragariae]KAE9130803.1 hypothetical protein PF010_g3725 [Phytophthora fragariae]KAE9141414.1 hypothetical protein PF007_g217 [Phytophthora fragariae]